MTTVTTPPDDHLRLGVPSKGRLGELAVELLEQAGLKFRRQNRGLFARVGGLPIDLIFLRTDDIPTLCDRGAIDMGITGEDLVEEARASVDTVMRFGLGRCRLSYCVPDDSPYQSAKDLDGLRIATSFPNITEAHLARGGAAAKITALSGSVEAMVRLGVADAIVDLVETGSTLVANRLKVLEDIGHYETVLIQNRDGRMPEVVGTLLSRLGGVVLAQNYSMLEYNIPADRLAEASEITPGYKSPTVSHLQDPEWLAVQVMVRRGEVMETMDRLKAVGAAAIFEMSIHHCRL